MSGSDERALLVSATQHGEDLQGDLLEKDMGGRSSLLCGVSGTGPLLPTDILPLPISPVTHCPRAAVQTGENWKSQWVS